MPVRLKILRNTDEKAEEYGNTGNWRISPESKLNFEIARRYLWAKQVDDGMRYLAKAMKDPRNLEAWARAAFMAPTIDDAIIQLCEAEEQGRKLLEQDFGPDCLQKAPEEGGLVGQFWTTPETRPYMRVLHGLVDLHLTARRYSGALLFVLRMMELDAQDACGQHNLLPPLLIMEKQYIKALYVSQLWIQDEQAYLDGSAPPIPVWQPLSAEKIEEYATGYCSAELFYSAALSSFKARGNSLPARQYLLIAARLNPHILLRVLAKVEQPQKAKHRARDRNSREDASDFLWVVQQAWMEPDVWNWANSRDDAKQFLLKSCSRKGCSKREKTIAKFKRCATCHAVFYCSKDCQKADWKTHKPDCQEFEEDKQIRNEQTRETVG